MACLPLKRKPSRPRPLIEILRTWRSAWLSRDQCRAEAAAISAMASGGKQKERRTLGLASVLSTFILLPRTRDTIQRIAGRSAAQ
jgi:hypothetical protein